MDSNAGIAKTRRWFIVAKWSHPSRRSPKWKPDLCELTFVSNPSWTSITLGWRTSGCAPTLHRPATTPPVGMTGKANARISRVCNAAGHAPGHSFGRCRSPRENCVDDASGASGWGPAWVLVDGGRTLATETPGRKSLPKFRRVRIFGSRFTQVLVDLLVRATVAALVGSPADRPRQWHTDGLEVVVGIPIGDNTDRTRLGVAHA